MCSGNLASFPTCMETVLFKVSRIHVDNPVVPSAFMFSVAVTMASLKLLPLLNLAEFLPALTTESFQSLLTALLPPLRL